MRTSGLDLLYDRLRLGLSRRIVHGNRISSRTGQFGDSRADSSARAGYNERSKIPFG